LKAKLSWMALVIFIATAALMTAAVQAAPGNSETLQTDPTPTPEYWVGDPITISAEGCGKDCWTDRVPDSSNYEMLEDKDGDGDADLIVPEDQSWRGHLLVVNRNNLDPSTTYDPEVRYVFGSATGWFSQDLEILDALGTSTCVGTVETCDAVGFSKWPHGTPNDSQTGGHLEGWRTRMQFVEGSISYTIRPIYYGQPEECEDPDPELLPVFAENTLSGTDDVGDHYDLVSGSTYYIRTSEGPWNDGTNDRYDVALSFDGGITWQTLGGLAGDPDNGDMFDVICSVDPGLYSTLKFTADEDHLSLDIRVNDEDGEFVDNSGTIKYTINYNQMGGDTCGQYYTSGELINSGTIDVSDPDGTSLGTTFYANAESEYRPFYKIRLLNAWSDNGSPSIDTDLKDYKASSWTQSSYHPQTKCVETAEDINGDPIARDLYMQADYEDLIFDMRAHDGNSNFGDNTTDIDFEIYAVDYDPPPSSCAARYEKGTLIETDTVNSQATQGIEIPVVINGLTPGTTYALEVPDYPGYWDAQRKNFDFEISEDRILWWHIWEDGSGFADCVTPLDQNRNLYYFQADQEHYYLRADDNNWDRGDNNGWLSVNLYGAKDNQIAYDPTEDCSEYYSLDSLIYSSGVDSSLFQGAALPNMFAEDQFYAIKLVPPMWNDAGFGDANWGDVAYDNAEITNPDFYTFSEFPGALCTETDAQGWATMFYQYQHGTYKLRAQDVDGDWTNNTGDLNFEVYTASRVGDAPNPSCELDYLDVEMWTWVAEDLKVPATLLPDGKHVMDQLTEGITYKFETSLGPAFGDRNTFGPTNPGYDLEISIDGGLSWQLLTDYLDCVVPVGYNHIRGFVTPGTTTGAVRVRFYDPVSGTVKNSGELEVDIWTSDHDDPASPNPGPGPGDGWDPVAGCEGTCFRPANWLKVAQWFEYGRCRFSEWLSWCPYHTRQLMALKDGFYNVEPFGTILEMIDTIAMLRNEVNSYNWGTEGGGADDTVTVTRPENFVFAPGEGGGAGIPLVLTGEDSPWGDGDIQLRDTSTPTYSTACNNMLADALGSRLALPMCFVFNILDQLGMMSWVQWLWDMAMIFGLGFYIKRSWVDRLQ